MTSDFYLSPDIILSNHIMSQTIKNVKFFEEKCNKSLDNRTYVHYN